MRPNAIASIISYIAGAIFYVGGAVAIAYFIYTAIAERVVLVHALLAVLALLVTRLVQVWYRVKASAGSRTDSGR